MQKTKTLTSFKDACEIIRVYPGDEVTADQKAEIIFQAACVVLDRNPLILPDYSNIESEYAKSSLAHHKLEVVRNAVIGEWVPDWNKREYKWAPIFWMDSPGFRFDGSYFGFVGTYLAGGSRLSFETEKQSDFVGQDCIAFYRDFYGAVALAPAD